MRSWAHSTLLLTLCNLGQDAKALARLMQQALETLHHPAARMARLARAAMLSAVHLTDACRVCLSASNSSVLALQAGGKCIPFACDAPDHGDENWCSSS